MGKLNLIKKHGEYHSQFITVDTTDLDMVGMDTDDGILGKLEAILSDGYYIFELKGATGSVYYASRETDKYDRTVSEQTYHKNMHIYPFAEHSEWCENVNNFFDLMLEDDQAVGAINGIALKALSISGNNGRRFDLEKEIDDAKAWLLASVGDKKSSGRRKPAVFSFLCNWVRKNANNFVKYNGGRR